MIKAYCVLHKQPIEYLYKKHISSYGKYNTFLMEAFVRFLFVCRLWGGVEFFFAEAVGRKGRNEG